MDELKKNQRYTAEITGYSSTGTGVCRILGRAVFVDFALPGEVWEVVILKVTASAVYGRGDRLIVPSPARVDPACPVFGKCGGCGLMHMDYDEELRFKLDRANNALRHLAGLDFTLDGIAGADEAQVLRYRNKAIFAVGRADDGRALTGFFRERSHSLIPAPDCLIQTALSVRCASALRAFMDVSGVSAYDESTGKGLIRHIFVRCSLNYPQAVACVVAADRLGGQRSAALAAALRAACPELTGIALCVNRTRGNTVLAGDLHALWGNEFIEDTLLGLRFRISPQSFYQINPRQAEKLYRLALDYAGPDGSGAVLDLYCGIGTITLCLARNAKFVYGAESAEAAVRNARSNARANGVENVEFLLGDAAGAAKALAARGITPGAVVINPPRKGLSPALIDEIAGMSPARVVYVSCDPATLARDLKRFAELGYRPKRGQAVDMFPRTAHVEVCCLLERLIGEKPA